MGALDRKNRIGCAGEDSKRLSLVPGWDGWVDSGHTSERGPGGKVSRPL